MIWEWVFKFLKKSIIIGKTRVSILSVLRIWHSLWTGRRWSDCSAVILWRLGDSRDWHWHCNTAGHELTHLREWGPVICGVWREAMPEVKISTHKTKQRVNQQKNSNTRPLTFQQNRSDQLNPLPNKVNSWHADSWGTDGRMHCFYCLGLAFVLEQKHKFPEMLHKAR